jgi:molybdopterin synthase sulfur carrier subunit
MKYKIKAFGISREIIGSKVLVLEIPEGYTIAAMKQELFQKYPSFAGLKSLYVAVNNEYADEDVLIKEGDEIALIPPVSGG